MARLTVSFQAMQRRMVFMRHISALLLFIGCAISWAAPEQSQDPGAAAGNTRDVMKSVMGSILPPGIDPAALPDPSGRGASLMRTYCVQCHNLPSPGLHTGAEWPGVVARMQDRIMRVNEAERNLVTARPLNTQELTDLLHYLKLHGYQPLDVSRYPDIDSDIGKAFRQVCSQCHMLPDPKLHTETEWKEVVMRMRKNMETLGVTQGDDDAIAKVMGFLQTHAKK